MGDRRYVLVYQSKMSSDSTFARSRAQATSVCVNYLTKRDTGEKVDTTGESDIEEDADMVYWDIF